MPVKIKKFQDSEGDIYPLTSFEAVRNPEGHDIDTVKQDRLRSGENIKTINHQSLLGPGNLSIGGEGGITVSVNSNDEVGDLWTELLNGHISVVNVQWSHGTQSHPIVHCVTLIPVVPDNRIVFNYPGGLYISEVIEQGTIQSTDTWGDVMSFITLLPYKVITTEDTGDFDLLNTDDKSSLVYAINEVLGKSTWFVSTTVAEVGLLPHTRYVLDLTSESSVNLSTLNGIVSGKASEYQIVLETGATAPSVLWPSGMINAPVIEAGKIYEINIVADGHYIICKYDVFNA